MKENIKWSYLIYFLLFIQLITACSKVEDDPCLEKQQPVIDFKMGARIAHFNAVDTLIESDTILAFNKVEFLAPDGFDQYEWKIGRDERVFTDQRFSLIFTQPQEVVVVQLITQSTPDKICFPLDDGRDTLRKYLTIVPKEENPIYGDFHGYLEAAPEDTFTVRIFVDPVSGEGIHTININKGCYPEGIPNISVGLPLTLAYKKIIFGDDENFYIDNCKDPRGWFELDESGQHVVINYTTSIEVPNGIDTKREQHKFIGIRVK